MHRQEEGVGRICRQRPFSFQDVMDVRLGKTGQARDAPFGELAAADSFPQCGYQARFELPEAGHNKEVSCGPYFSRK